MAKDLETIPLERFLEALNKAAISRGSVEVRVAGVSAQAASRIDDFDPEKNRVDIATLGEGEIDRLMEPGAPVEISFTLSEECFLFKTVCAENRRGLRYHTLAFPREYYRIQRREFYRVRPPRVDSLALQVRPALVEDFETVIPLNVSLGGLLFHAVRPRWSAEDMDQGLILHLCFEICPILTLQARTNRVAQAPGRPRDLHVGVQFVNLLRVEEQALNRVMMQWQRELARDNPDE
jgi:c-di-GMP-binding flagellar brake protein YcgR